MDHCELEASLRHSVQTCLKMEKKEKTCLCLKFMNSSNPPVLHPKGKVVLEIYHRCSIAEMACFVSQAVTLGKNDLAFHSAFFF